MSVSRVATSRSGKVASAPSYICLSCRLAESQRRLRHHFARVDAGQGKDGGDSHAVDEGPTREYTGRSRVKSTGRGGDETYAPLYAPRWNLHAISGAVPKPSDSRAGARPGKSTSTIPRPVSASNRRPNLRMYHTSRPGYRQAAATTLDTLDTHEIPPFIFNTTQPNKNVKELKNLSRHSGIRAELRRWQELHADEEEATAVDVASDPVNEGLTNPITRLADEQGFHSTPEEEQDEREALTALMNTPGDEPGSDAVEARTRFLRTGDLVEVEYVHSERESVVAVFIRRIGTVAQLYTMQGKWLHTMEKSVQYSIPGWVDPALVSPLLEHLPDPADVEDHLETLLENAYMQDMSVPRHVAAPLVSRMVQFHAESKEIYRRHASTLDRAHDILAHDDKLRFTNLSSIATKLLDLPAAKLPLTGLFAVRQALSNAGFAFSMDRRSHRLTGHVTIRTREQVRMAEKVKRWLREWQDDLANRATMSEAQSSNLKTSKGAQIVASFISKAKKIVASSRLDRQPTPYGSIGPSQTRLPITPESDSVRISTGSEFDEHDREIVKFMEAWSLSNMFHGLPRVESLPPLILQATGMYAEYSLGVPTGMMFLQELGTILPYENRVRFDQHLLLPQSEHSKPLQDLMNKVIKLQLKPDFVDSMAHLRHDWKDLPVYCIDDASAHEIDDGLSIEPVTNDQGHEAEQWWVHIHIANPTAFFSPTHDLAKMSQHMHESVYMPERAYMMMPRWATQGHFSLARDRPCITFSARMDAEGKVLENKIRSGTIRNVFRFTPDEISEVLGLESDEQNPDTVITVGGTPPPPRARVSRIKDVTAQQVKHLKMLRHLAECRQKIRKAAGGLFFETRKPSISVWESYKGPGLAWDRPHRRGSRLVQGDPVIQMRTKGFVNWFAPVNNANDVLVREMMLLACELAASWCATRAVPGIFRGSVPHPDRMDPERFLRDIMMPAVKTSPGGEYPMHLGVQYLQTFGSTQLSTTPFTHKILGMKQYGKVTSPLRRYADMIVHWQIEAALREEAKTGKSLVTTADPERVDRSFLPFNAPTLRNLFRVMQPREAMVTRAKSYSEDYWKILTLFRAFHFGEAELPYYTKHPTDPKKNTVRGYMHSMAQGVHKWPYVGVMAMELNFSASMMRPEREASKGRDGVAGLDEARMGDVWECEIEEVAVYNRTLWLRPLRLLERVEGA